MKGISPVSLRSLLTILGLAMLFAAPALANKVAAQQLTWVQGITMGAASDGNTTKSLALRTGPTAGQFTIGDEMTFNLRVLSTDSNRNYPMRLTAANLNRLEFVGRDVSMTLVAQGTGEAYADITCTDKVRNVVAVLEVSTGDKPTSSTLLTATQGVSIVGSTGPYVFQVLAPKALRSLRNNGFRIVTPMRSNAKIRVYLGREEKSADAINSVTVTSSAAPALRREDELAATSKPETTKPSSL